MNVSVNVLYGNLGYGVKDFPPMSMGPSGIPQPTLSSPPPPPIPFLTCDTPWARSGKAWQLHVGMEWGGKGVGIVWLRLGLFLTCVCHTIARYDFV